MPKIIAVANQKGGVGKTTTCINLAAALGRNGFASLVIDLDPQANATSGLGFDKKSLKSSIYNVLIGESKISDTILETPFLNLHLVPSHPDLTGAEVELINMLGREYRLQEAINDIINRYPFIIIDCPPSLNILTVNAMVCANYMLLPIQCEYYALEGIAQLMKVMDLVRDRLNPRLKIGGILMTMYDRRLNLSVQVIEEVKKHFKDKVYKTMIPRNTRLGEAPSFGQPVLYYASSSSGAISYSQLAQEIIELGHRETLNP